MKRLLAFIVDPFIIIIFLLLLIFRFPFNFIFLFSLHFFRAHSSMQIKKHRFIVNLLQLQDDDLRMQWKEVTPIGRVLLVIGQVSTIIVNSQNTISDITIYYFDTPFPQLSAIFIIKTDKSIFFIKVPQVTTSCRW